MAIERYKDVTVEGREFRIGLVNAKVGAWCGLQLAAGKVTDEDVYEKIRTYLFNEISVYVDKGGERVPMRIYDNGRWLNPEFEYDLLMVDGLFWACLGFNFDPFLAKLRKEAADKKAASEAAIQDTTQ